MGSDARVAPVVRCSPGLHCLQHRLSVKRRLPIAIAPLAREDSADDESHLLVILPSGIVLVKHRERAQLPACAGRMNAKRWLEAFASAQESLEALLKVLELS